MPSKDARSTSPRRPMLTFSATARFALISTALFACPWISAAEVTAPVQGPRSSVDLSRQAWKVSSGTQTCPEYGSPAWKALAWRPVDVPHVFQHRGDRTLQTWAWYATSMTLAPSDAGKEIFLVFEGAATQAQVYVNGVRIGEHLGAYTRFVVDATSAMHGGENQLAVGVDDGKEAMANALPCNHGLYWVWGGLYRPVSVLSTNRRHIDAMDDASPGVYITPTCRDHEPATLDVRVELRNDDTAAWNATIEATLVDPDGRSVATLKAQAEVKAGEAREVALHGSIDHPRHWRASRPELYHVRTDVYSAGKLVDSTVQPTGFRTIELRKGLIFVDGERTLLNGPNLHQETEDRASAVTSDDLRANFRALQDLGVNFVRFSHYPRAQIEYDLCDTLGFWCWSENGHSSVPDRLTPMSERITREMVKQNYNHPSLAIWSVGNEASMEPANAFADIVRSLDSSRLIMAANMKCTKVDAIGQNIYPGWYVERIWNFHAKDIVSETGAGGVVTCHGDFDDLRHEISKYEPEEYQQLTAEQRFQSVFYDDHDRVGLFSWWVLRDFCNNKYHNDAIDAVWNGLNTKGLLSYDGEPKDVYWLYRCFSRSDVTTIHIASQRYLVRRGAPDNGIKAYSNASRLSLSINGKDMGSLDSGAYRQPGGFAVKNVFLWKVPLFSGRNAVVVHDDHGHRDEAILYALGEGAVPAAPAANQLVTNITMTNAVNQGIYLDLPVRPDWPIYTDLDGSADQSFSRIPEALRSATWIGIRSVTRAGQESGLSFTVTRAADIYVMCAALQPDPPGLAAAGFEPCASPGLAWHDQRLLLIPARLFRRHVDAVATISLPAPGQDIAILLKE